MTSDSTDAGGRPSPLLPAGPSPEAAVASAAGVAVVTRTLERPTLLARAGRSVAAQTYRDFVWVVVNDGGDPAAVADAIAASGVPLDQVCQINLAPGVGMEAAGNAGATAVVARYLVLHDDDDTWEPAFLERTVGYLDSPRGARHAGVVTHANYVSEEMRGEEVIEHARGPYDPDLIEITTPGLLRRNLFPPISFVVRREVWSRVGGYHPDLRALGDWYFNVKVLFEGEIAVLPETLANWHHRDRGNAVAGPGANSVIGAVDAHRDSVGQVREALLRDLTRRHGEGVATLVQQHMTAADPPGGGRSAGGRGDAIGRVRPLASRSDADAVTGPHELLRALCDIADRRWLAAHLPFRARVRLVLRRTRGGNGAKVDFGWSDLAPWLAQAHVPIAPDFDEVAYLAANRDVSRAVDVGQIESGYAHWVRFGRLEGRLRPLTISAGRARFVRAP